MNAKESIVFMFKGVSNWAPYWQFHFGEGGGDFKLGTLLAVSFWGWRGGFKLGTILAVSFWGGRGVPLQVDWKSVRFMDSGWLSTAATSGQLC